MVQVKGDRDVDKRRNTEIEEWCLEFSYGSTYCMDAFLLLLKGQHQFLTRGLQTPTIPG